MQVIEAPQPSALVRYEEMRAAVERCARIDEAADIRDKASALAAYARQRDDADLLVWTQEIKLRASIRVGQLVQELDAAQGVRVDLTSSQRREEVTTKAEAIADAGLSKSEAYRYQELAGPREHRARTAASAAVEKHFAEARANKTPATMAGLKGAIKSAVHATVGPRPTSPLPTPAEAMEQSRLTGEAVPASDGNLHNYVDPEERQKQLDWYSFEEPVAALAKLGITPTRAVEVMTPSQAKRIRKPLTAALAWLTEFEELCNA